MDKQRESSANGAPVSSSMSESAVLLAKIDTLQRDMTVMMDRQRAVIELYEDAAPILKLMLNEGANQLQILEDNGYFEFGKELLGVVNNIVTSFSADEVRELGQNIGRILRTVKHLTGPEIMNIANRAAAAAEHGAAEGVGVLGMLRASRDDEVRRGLAVALEVLRTVGSIKGDRREEQKRDLARLLGPRSGGNTPQPKKVDFKAATAPTGNVPKPKVPTQPAATLTTAAQAPAGEVVGLELDAEGFLVDRDAWSREFAAEMATALGIGDLGEERWSLIDWAREDFREHGSAPNIRRMSVGSGTNTKDIYRLFPHAPGKTIAKIAGTKKPAGCI